MPIFRYTATDQSGRTLKGNYDAISPQEVAVYLRRNGLVPVAVQRSLIHMNLTIGRAVKLRDLVTFTRMQAALIRASVPHDQALKALYDQATTPALKGATQRMIVDLESGHTFSEAFRNQSKIFDSIYVNMLAAGESSGNLDLMLERLATYLERNNTTAAKIKSAFMYPIAVLTIGLVCMALLLMFVLPGFAELFNAEGVELPLPTRVAMFLSSVLVNGWPLVLAALAGLAVGLRMLRKVPKYREHWDWAILHIPVLGMLVRKSATARFVRTFGTLMGSGVPVLEALDLTAPTTGNARFERAIREARLSVSTGSSIAGALKKSGMFAPMVIAMFTTGEDTGQLDHLLDKVADYYEQDVTQTTDGALKLLEPFMILVLGGMVGGVMISIYLPLFSMITVFTNR